MPVATNYSWYLGTPGNIETDPFSVLGTYGGPGNALANAVTTLETSTDDPAGIINENTAGQSFTYDVGSGPVTQQLEQMNYYNVAYTLVDGTTGTAQMWMVQAVNGDTFALMDAGADNDIMQAVGLRSLEITSLIAPEYSWQQGYHSEAVAVCYAEGTRLRTPQV